MLNMPNVDAEIRIPVTIVTIIDVYLGRNPNKLIRRFPTFVPILSPKKAINPPMTVIMRRTHNPTNMAIYLNIKMIISIPLTSISKSLLYYNGYRKIKKNSTNYFHNWYYQFSYTLHQFLF